MQILPSSLRIGVLRGGPSAQYDASLQSGQHVLKHLSETHQPIDIFISKEGEWHVQGIVRSPEKILKNVDVVFNALHGAYGEDGQVQEILDTHGVLYTGSDKFASRLAIHKWLTKERAKSVGIKTPLSSVIRTEDSVTEKLREVFAAIPYPIVVKPTTGGWSRDIYTATSPADLLVAVDSILLQYPSVLVEEKITGRPISCVTLDSFRGQEVYAFPPRDGAELPFSREETQYIEGVAKQIHQELGLSHYSESDFIVSPKRGVYFLEVNTLPDISEKSLVRKSLESVGSNMKEFLHHVVGLALERK